MEIVEDTDTAFELKVGECIWADTFRRAEGFNSKIEMVRDLTLMQGHSICNHCYLWKG